MSFFPQYTNTIETLSIHLACIFFLLFLFTIIIRKAASKEDAYIESNRIHFYFGAIYAITLFGLATFLDQINGDFFTCILTGLYIFFSLHYAFIFPLIGICKKSISIQIMESIYSIRLSGNTCSKEALINMMADRKASIEDIRRNRLNQMIILKFATARGNHYQITTIGKKVHALRATILCIWNQEPL
jgi:hypothetical protein